MQNFLRKYLLSYLKFILDEKVANLVYVNMVNFVDLGLLIRLKSRAFLSLPGRLMRKIQGFVAFPQEAVLFSTNCTYLAFQRKEVVIISANFILGKY